MPPVAGVVQFQVNPPPRPVGPHKRLQFTAAQWAVLVPLAPGPLPVCLRPDPKPGATAAEVDAAADELRSVGVLVAGPGRSAVPGVVQSLTLLASAPIAVHLVISSRAVARESWWAMDLTRTVAAFKGADGGVDLIVAATRDAAALMAASVPRVDELDPSAASRASSISAALGSQPATAVRQRLTVPLELLTPPDPLGLAEAGEHSQHDRAAAAALVRGARGTLTARVHGLSWAGGSPRPVVGERSWWATGAGWWALSAAPGSGRVEKAQVRRVRLTPVEANALGASLAPMLTTAFRSLAAASEHGASATRPDLGDPRRRA